jgi:hypothetical protein
VVSYFIVIFFVVGCANRYSEEYFSLGRAGGTGDEFMDPKGAVARKVSGTTE